MHFSFLAVSSLLAVTSAVADFTFNTTFSSEENGQLLSPVTELKAQGATTECLTAFAANIECDPILFNLTLTPSETRQTQANLEKSCNPTCERSLAGWIESIFTACKDQPKPVSIISQTSEDEYMSRYYRIWCAKDLSSGEFCLLQQDDDAVYLEKGDTNQTDVQAACADSCFTQTAASLWQTYEALNSTDTINVADPRKLCKNVDFSKYEILAPVSEIATGSDSSSTSAGSSSTTIGASTTATTAATRTGATGTSTNGPTGAASQTTTGAAAASTSAKPNDASSIVRGVMPVAWAALAMAVAISL